MSRLIYGVTFYKPLWEHLLGVEELKFLVHTASLDGKNASATSERTSRKPLERFQSDVGAEVVVVKNGKRICGAGAAFANAPIAQDKAYFEIKIQSTGIWGVGLATRQCSINKVPLGDTEESWVIRNDGKLFHKNEEAGKLPEAPQEGDVLGLSYDHVELNFLLNGKPLNCPVRGIKGTVYPIFYVDDGAVLDVQFTGFQFDPPDGFDSIMIEQSLL